MIFVLHGVIRKLSNIQMAFELEKRLLGKELTYHQKSYFIQEILVDNRKVIFRTPPEHPLIFSPVTEINIDEEHSILTLKTRKKWYVLDIK